MVDDYQQCPAKKAIIDIVMPSVIMSELPVERSFARDKTQTSYRNLAMQVYGQIKRRQCANTIRAFSRADFSKHFSQVQRYADPSTSDMRGDAVLEQYEAILHELHTERPTASEAVVQSAKLVCCEGCYNVLVNMISLWLPVICQRRIIAIITV